MSKLNAVVFGIKNVNNVALPNLMLHNDLLHYVKEYTYLGTHLEELFTFEPHAKATFRLVSHRIKILQKIRKYFDYADILYVMRGHFVNFKSNKIERLEFVYRGTIDVKN